MTAPTESADANRAGIRMGSAAPTFLVADVGGTAHREFDVRDPNGYILVFSEYV